MSWELFSYYYQKGTRTRFINNRSPSRQQLCTKNIVVSRPSVIRTTYYTERTRVLFQSYYNNYIAILLHIIFYIFIAVKIKRSTRLISVRILKTKTKIYLMTCRFYQCLCTPYPIGVKILRVVDILKWTFLKRSKMFSDRIILSSDNAQNTIRHNVILYETRFRVNTCTLFIMGLVYVQHYLFICVIYFYINSARLSVDRREVRARRISSKNKLQVSLHTVYVLSLLPIKPIFLYCFVVYTRPVFRFNAPLPNS